MSRSTRSLSVVGAMVAEQRRAQASQLALAAAAAATVSAAAVFLLGLSGWFITSAALAGAAGSAAAHAFNYMMPSATIRFLAIIRTGSRYVERVSGHEAALKALAALRPQLFRAFAAGDPTRTLALSAGEASARLVQDVDAVQTLFVRLSSPWAFAVGALAAILMATLASPLAGLAVLLAMGLAAAGAVVIGRKAEPVGRQVQAETGLFKARLASLAGAAPELRAYDLVDWAVEEAAVAGRVLDVARADLARYAGWMAAWQAIVQGLAVGMAVLVAHPSAPALVALAALAAVTGVEAAAGLAGALRENGSARMAVERLDQLAAADPSAGTGRPEDMSLATAIFGGSLSPPARVGIIGPSGCGKTSLIERALGLRSAIPGEWQVGGCDAADLVPGSGRFLFAYAAQDVRLLDGTVRENLRLAAPGADDDTLWAALDDAALSLRFRLSAKGLDTQIGVNGECLSGGERRRLGLARAFLRDAPWLVLDEPTEGVDAITEARILERLDRRLSDRGQGLILISHRLAPMDLCNVVRRMGETAAISREVEPAQGHR